MALIGAICYCVGGMPRLFYDPVFLTALPDLTSPLPPSPNSLLKPGLARKKRSPFPCRSQEVTLTVLQNIRITFARARFSCDSSLFIQIFKRKSLRYFLYRKANHL